MRLSYAYNKNLSPPPPYIDVIFTVSEKIPL